MSVTKKLVPESGKREATVEAILEATALLMKARMDPLPGTRAIASKSGYSVGTIYNYFSTVGLIVSRVVIKRQRAAHLRIEVLINQHDRDETIDVLCGKVMAMCFSSFQVFDPRLVRLVFNLARTHAEKPEELDYAADVLVQPLLAAIGRDRTGTFRNLGAQELLLFLRGIVFLIRSPLLEDSAFFATAAHRDLVMDYMLRIFSTRPDGQDAAESKALTHDRKPLTSTAAHAGND